VARSRRLVRNALILAIAALTGIAIGEALGRAFEGPTPREASPAAGVRTTDDSRAVREPDVAPGGARIGVRDRSVELAVDGRVRIDGGEALGDARAIAAALRRGTGDVIVVPRAEVSWVAVVDFVDFVRRVTAEGGGSGVVRLASPPDR
jgi:hypothetical protein